MKLRDLRDLSHEDLESWVVAGGYPKYRSAQILSWLYGCRGVMAVSDFDEMKNLPIALREALAREFRVSLPEPIQVQEDSDGTRKFLLKLQDGETVETVLIPETVKVGQESPRAWRFTLCLSSQVGCAIGCRFCRTATMGLKRNMTQSEILSQVLSIRRYLKDKGVPEVEIRNLVFMGMGEPLHNLENVMGAISWLVSDAGLGFSSKRITVSTSGLLPEIQRLLLETRVRLAISLNATDEKTRTEIMPITKKYSLSNILDLCRKLALPRKDRITFEYVLLAGVNDRPKDARNLIRILHGIPAKINLIPFNEFPDAEFKRPLPEQVDQFRSTLSGHGLQVNVRQSRGRQVLAACGQLRSLGTAAKRPPAALAGRSLAQ